ncbi:MAG: BlaI/MecI/CopY family transcriptional regulator [Clostridium sp.]|jgi:predicted transcriptional regulator|nr:BlaI/MecI/CopY family transcriptional regulator [Clostridium sp.]
MNNFQLLSPSEEKVALVIWEMEPMTSTELVAIAAKRWDWKRTTTFTILGRMVEKGVIQNQNATLTSLVGRDEYYTHQSRTFVKDVYGGSLPQFVASFIGEKKIDEKLAAELKRLIDDHLEG